MSSYQKQIHDYLSGELSQEDEKALFDGLSRNDEWREEMQFQLRLERAMEQDLNSIAVPPATSSAVFESLGFRHLSVWSKFMPLFAGSPVKRILLASVAGMMLLAVVEYVVVSSGSSTSSRLSSTSRNAADVVDSTQQITEVIVPDPQPFAQTSAPNAPAPSVFAGTGARSTQSLSGVAIPNALSAVGAPAAISNSMSEHYPAPATIPNEPLLYYFDIGKLYSVHYLTQQKIIGVSDHGQIFVSEDGGHSWALQVSGVTNDLYGIHFVDTLNGVAVGATGTILLTADAGNSWRRVESGTNAILSTVRYVTRDTIYICGEDGMMLRSATGGTLWKVETTGIHSNLFRMSFENGWKGEVRGANGAHISTTDGGETWNILK